MVDNRAQLGLAWIWRVQREVGFWEPSHTARLAGAPCLLVGWSAIISQSYSLHRVLQARFDVERQREGAQRQLAAMEGTLRETGARCEEAEAQARSSKTFYLLIS
jgi:hypothetical protein